MFKVTTESLSVQQINDLVKRPTDGWEWKGRVQ